MTISQNGCYQWMSRHCLGEACLWQIFNSWEIVTISLLRILECPNSESCPILDILQSWATKTAKLCAFGHTRDRNSSNLGHKNGQIVRFWTHERQKLFKLGPQKCPNRHFQFPMPAFRFVTGTTPRAPRRTGPLTFASNWALDLATLWSLSCRTRGRSPWRNFRSGFHFRRRICSSSSSSCVVLS